MIPSGKRREAYSDIFCGRWEDYDPFLVGGRGQAVMDEHCSFFRAFQGWTSLSRAGPGEGTIRILPLLKEATAALLLRPLLKGVKGYEEQIGMQETAIAETNTGEELILCKEKKKCSFRACSSN